MVFRAERLHRELYARWPIWKRREAGIYRDSPGQVPLQLGERGTADRPATRVASSGVHHGDGSVREQLKT